MATTQNLVLFWIFIGFFLTIGIVAILTILGIVKTDERFRKWAVGGFAAAVTGVVIVWAKAEPPLDIFINLEPPKSVPLHSFELVSGTYEYNEQSSSGKSEPNTGPIELTAGQQIGWWTAKIPYSGKDNSVKLILEDRHGKSWVVHPFYPNHTWRPMVANDTPQNRKAKSIPTLELIKSAYAGESRIKFNNYAEVSSSFQNRTYYRWRLFVDEPISVLNQISEVHYLLHPTFPNPLQVRTDPYDQFAVETTGWGVFTVQITIMFKNDTYEKTSYHLDFNKKFP